MVVSGNTSLAVPSLTRARLTRTSQPSGTDSSNAMRMRADPTTLLRQVLRLLLHHRTRLFGEPVQKSLHQAAHGRRRTRRPQHRAGRQHGERKEPRAGQHRQGRLGHGEYGPHHQGRTGAGRVVVRGQCWYHGAHFVPGQVCSAVDRLAGHSLFWFSFVMYHEVQSRSCPSSRGSLRKGVPISTDSKRRERRRGPEVAKAGSKSNYRTGKGEKREEKNRTRKQTRSKATDLRTICSV